MRDDGLVSAIIPAFNAAATLAETLGSVRSQTHRHLEIVVVDDGSQDSTAEIAKAHAAEDGRIRLIRQENGGVARARNTGVAASHGDYLAPVDADDLWHPEKIARQLAALRAAGPDVGYAYTFSRHIDAAGRVTRDYGYRLEGAAFLRAILHNHVGNGSALLIRRAAFDSVGGYDPALRDAGMQGTEDYLLQALIARHWRVVCVPAYLTGYRKQPGAMSNDHVRMVHSRCAACDAIARRFPETPANILNAARASTSARTAIRIRRDSRRQALEMLRNAAAADVRIAVTVVATVAAQKLARIVAQAAGSPRRAGGAVSGGPQFRDLDPDQPLGEGNPLPLAGRLAALAAQDEAFFAPSATPLAPRAPRRDEWHA